MYQSVPQKWSVRLSPSVMEIMSIAYMRNEMKDKYSAKMYMGIMQNVHMNALCTVFCHTGVPWDIFFILCGVKVRSGWFKLYEWILYYELCKMKCHVHCVQFNALFVHVHYVWSPVWQVQRSSTWPIFDLNYNYAKFHHSTSTRSWDIVKTDGRTDGHTTR